MRPFVAAGASAVGGADEGVAEAEAGADATAVLSTAASKAGFHEEMPVAVTRARRAGRRAGAGGVRCGESARRGRGRAEPVSHGVAEGWTKAIARVCRGGDGGDGGGGCAAVLVFHMLAREATGWFGRDGTRGCWRESALDMRGGYGRLARL